MDLRQNKELDQQNDDTRLMQFNSAAHALNVELKVPFQELDTITISRRESKTTLDFPPYATKEQRRLMRNKQNRKEKLKEEKILCFEFPRARYFDRNYRYTTITRDYATNVTRLSQ